jgi:DNA-binding CsgD family transcriptional regulator
MPRVSRQLVTETDEKSRAREASSGIGRIRPLLRIELKSLLAATQMGDGGVRTPEQYRVKVAEACRQLARFRRAALKGVTVAEGESAAMKQSRGLEGRILGLSPRLRETLAGLLDGASEKQIARQLGLSRHTVHTYVKALHNEFGVSSRGELLARFITRPA